LLPYEAAWLRHGIGPWTTRPPQRKWSLLQTGCIMDEEMSTIVSLFLAACAERESRRNLSRRPRRFRSAGLALTRHASVRPHFPNRHRSRPFPALRIRSRSGGFECGIEVDRGHSCSLPLSRGLNEGQRWDTTRAPESMASAPIAGPEFPSYRDGANAPVVEHSARFCLLPIGPQ
jgi:hypothetical protein